MVRRVKTKLPFDSEHCSILPKISWASGTILKIFSLFQ